MPSGLIGTDTEFPIPRCPLPFLLDCVLSFESMADEFYLDNFFVKVYGLPAPSESIDHSYLAIDLASTRGGGSKTSSFVSHDANSDNRLKFLQTCIRRMTNHLCILHKVHKTL